MPWQEVLIKPEGKSINYPIACYESAVGCRQDSHSNADGMEVHEVQFKSWAGNLRFIKSRMDWRPQTRRRLHSINRHRCRTVMKNNIYLSLREVLDHFQRPHIWDFPKGWNIPWGSRLILFKYSTLYDCSLSCHLCTFLPASLGLTSALLSNLFFFWIVKLLLFPNS